MRLLSDPSAPADQDVKRLVLCTGKVAYDLMEARDAAALDKFSVRKATAESYARPMAKRMRALADRGATDKDAKGDDLR